jgi:anti-anti-sigma regulatory factor
MAVEDYKLPRIGRYGAVLIIDMSGTTFCDSAGWARLSPPTGRPQRPGTELRLVATAVLRILTLVGADQLIPIYPALDAALAARK